MASGKIAIVGVGAVGQAILYSLANQSVGSEYVLIDHFKEVAEGNALDVADSRASFDVDFRVKSGNFSDCGDADVVIITAGAAQKPGQSRLELIEINAKIMKGIIFEINNTAFRGIILVVSNPVDVLTRLASKIAKVGKSRVIGSGTSLDSKRLINEIAVGLDYSPKSIQAYVIGEHGDTSVFAHSCSTISGKKLSSFPQVKDSLIHQWQDNVRQKAGRIIKLKKNTSFGIGGAIAEIVAVILRNERKVIVLSANIKGYYGIEHECFAGTTGIVTYRNGLEEIFELPISDSERKLLHHSVETLNNTSKHFLKDFE